jgi:hypothetical protein
MIRVNLLRRVVPVVVASKGHHRRDVFGRPISRAGETRRYRSRYPGRRKKWDATYRQSDAGTQAHQKYNETDKGKKRVADWHLRRTYGKTLAEKQEQYEKQNGLCTLCEKPLPDQVSRCCWDHNHSTGQMRDLLHRHCNLLVGAIEDELHDRAVEYVARNTNVQS